MTAILGISAFYHDSAAAIVLEGNVIAVAQETLLKKNMMPVTKYAINYVLGELD